MYLNSLSSLSMYQSAAINNVPANNKKNENSQQSKPSCLQEIAKMPSFCARKPLTEDQKCRKILSDAVTDEDKMRFLTKDEITDMTKAIKGFKTAGSKTELVNKLLYNESDDCCSKLNAHDITTFFTVMSGKPANIQKYMAEDLGKTYSEDAQARLNLISSGKVTTDDLKYLDEHLTGDDDTKSTKCAFLFDVLLNCPNLIQHKKLIVDKVNMDADVLFTIDDLSKCYNPKKDNTKSISKMISFITKDNASDMSKIASAYCRYDEPYRTKMMDMTTKKNLEYIAQAVENEGLRGVFNTITFMKNRRIAIPERTEGTSKESYYLEVNRYIQDIKDKEKKVMDI